MSTTKAATALEQQPEISGVSMNDLLLEGSDVSVPPEQRGGHVAWGHITCVWLEQGEMYVETKSPWRHSEAVY